MAMAKRKAVDPQAHRVAELMTSGPLAGKSIVVTRAQKQADGLSSLLKQFGADVIEAPVIDIREPDSYDPLDTSLQDILQYDWLILTSVNGVEAMFSRLEPLGLSRGPDVGQAAGGCLVEDFRQQQFHRGSPAR